MQFTRLLTISFRASSPQSPKCERGHELGSCCLDLSRTPRTGVCSHTQQKRVVVGGSRTQQLLVQSTSKAQCNSSTCQFILGLVGREQMPWPLWLKAFVFPDPPTTENNCLDCPRSRHLSFCTHSCARVLPGSQVLGHRRAATLSAARFPGSARSAGSSRCT